MISIVGVGAIALDAAQSADDISVDIDPNIDGIITSATKKLSGIELSTGPPETETVVKTVSQPVSVFTLLPEIKLYKSGAAEITLAEDHGCFDQILFGHAKNSMPDDAYQSWRAPEFAGPKVVDLKSVVKSIGPYPSREFRVELSSSEGLCVSTTLKHLEFKVPESYMPSESN